MERQKDLLLVAHKMFGEFTKAEIEQLHKKAWRRCIADCTMTIHAKGDFNSSQVLIFDSYVVKELSIFQRFRYHLRKLWTAALRKVGASPLLVVVTYHRD